MRTFRTTGDVTLSSRTAITEWGDDADADVIADSLALFANGAIGTATNAFETRVNELEALAIDGGINLVNYGDVAIGEASGEPCRPPRRGG